MQLSRKAKNGPYQGPLQDQYLRNHLKYQTKIVHTAHFFIKFLDGWEGTIC